MTLHHFLKNKIHTFTSFDLHYDHVNNCKIEIQKIRNITPIHLAEDSKELIFFDYNKNDLLICYVTGTSTRTEIEIFETSNEVITILGEKIKFQLENFCKNIPTIDQFLKNKWFSNQIRTVEFIYKTSNIMTAKISITGDHTSKIIFESDGLSNIDAFINTYILMKKAFIQMS